LLWFGYSGLDKQTGPKPQSFEPPPFLPCLTFSELVVIHRFLHWPGEPSNFSTILNEIPRITWLTITTSAKNTRAVQIPGLGQFSVHTSVFKRSAKTDFSPGARVRAGGCATVWDPTMGTSYPSL